MRGSTLRACLIGLGTTFLVAAPAGARDGFDVPLDELTRIAGQGQVAFAVAGLGSADSGGSLELAIDVAGTPLAAWLYWSGELYPRNPNPVCNPGCDQMGTPDPSVVLHSPVLGPVVLDGAPAGGRTHIFSDERFDTAGEHVMRAEVPLAAFAPGVNALTVTDFAGTDGNGVPYYRAQYGVALLVAYRAAAAPEHEVVVLDGADVASEKYGHYVEPQWWPEANSEPVCFAFDALAGPAAARLSFAVGGMTEYWIDGAGQPQGPGAPERTLWAHGSGPLPSSLLTGGPDIVVLEEDQLIRPATETPAGFFFGRKMSVFESAPGALGLAAGDTWACFQIELFPPVFEQGRPIAQNITVEFAALGFERGAGGGCLTREAEWWAQRRTVVETFLPVETCGLLVTQLDPRRVTAGGAGFVPLVRPSARPRRTTSAEIQLAVQCFAAELNLNATLAGGGDCAAVEPALVARVGACCDTLCGTNPPPGSPDVAACIADVRAFNALEDTLPPFGPFL